MFLSRPRSKQARELPIRLNGLVDVAAEVVSSHGGQEGKGKREKESESERESEETREGRTPDRGGARAHTRSGPVN
jgi:hypothetical protein